jgi:Lar family restriction alleviation protein
MTESLLECPFCGPNECKPYKESDDNYTKYIMCGHCDARSGHSEDWEGAIDYWNTRSCDKKSNDYIQGFNDAKKQMISIIENLPDKSGER